MDELYSKTICPWPWIGWSSQTNGHLRICPASQASSSRGLCKTEEKTPLRANETNMTDARNNPVHRDLRRRMLLGEKASDVCSKCLQEEDAGLVSRRQTELKRNWIPVETLAQYTEPDGTILTDNIPLRLFDIRLGNRCNLTCRMCSPGSSSKWYKEWYETKHTKFFDGGVTYPLKKNEDGNVMADTKDFEWHENSDLWQFLLNNAGKTAELHFSGGEPFLIDSHYDLLRDLANRGLAKDILISYNTNLTTLPGKIMDYWKEFKTVQVAVSIDALGAANDYIRSPSKFTEIEKNLRRLDESAPNVSFWINTTVQLLNSYEFFDLIEWILTSEFKKLNHWFGKPLPMHWFLSHTRLNRPEAFSLEALSPKAREKWFHKASTHLEWLRAHLEKEYPNDTHAKTVVYERFSMVINGYENLLKTKDKSYLLPEFFKEIERGDKFRNQNFADIFPELNADLRSSLEVSHVPG